MNGDELGLRLFAHAAADLAPTLLIPLNVERVVRDRRDALDELALAVTPRSFRADLVACLGLSSASGAEVRAAVGRLGSDLLAFIREHAGEVEPELPRYLGDGTLESHLKLIA